jgi:hypothetical protein
MQGDERDALAGRADRMPRLIACDDLSENSAEIAQ